MFSEIGAHNFRNIHRKTPALESPLNKVAGLQAWNFIKKRLQYRCVRVNIMKFLRTAFLTYRKSGTRDSGPGTHTWDSRSRTFHLRSRTRDPSAGTGIRDPYLETGTYKWDPGPLLEILYLGPYLGPYMWDPIHRINKWDQCKTIHFFIRVLCFLHCFIFNS